MTKENKAETKITAILLLHDIRSVVNVGALFRTADAIGISKILISGVTPAPIDRFGRIRADFAKAALGAEQSVSWETVNNPTKTILTLKNEAYKVISIEQNEKSIDYKDYSLAPAQKLLIIPGNEVTGVPNELLELSDIILEVPMRGMKESLNVSVATGIVLYRILDQ